MNKNDTKELLDLGWKKSETISFSNFIGQFIEDPQPFLRTSHTIIYEAIKSFGYKIVIRSGRPMFRYNLFDDPFCDGINAVYGQDLAIKETIDVIEAVGRDNGPSRGMVLVGPPASGKTNIVDLICMGLEEYSKKADICLYSFYIELGEGKDVVRIRSPFRHNPLLLFHYQLEGDENGVRTPRKALFDLIQERHDDKDIKIPTFFQRASLDKVTLDILDGIMDNPEFADLDLFDIVF